MEAINLEGMSFFEVESISVNEWHRLPDGQGRPEQVHMFIQLKDVGIPIVMRFKSGKPMDELIVALITHRKAVFGGKHGNS